METYSISFRLQRVTKEYAFVRVLVTDEIMRTNEYGEIILDERGTARIDGEKMTKRAIELGYLPSVEWYWESQEITPHPIQKAPGPGEKSL